ncbi:unnamed protein product, partial [Ranitomeya imitator]
MRLKWVDKTMFVTSYRGTSTDVLIAKEKENNDPEQKVHVQFSIRKEKFFQQMLGRTQEKENISLIMSKKRSNVYPCGREETWQRVNAQAPTRVTRCGQESQDTRTGERNARPMIVRRDKDVSQDQPPSPHITTRGSVPTHYHTMLRPPTLPQEAPSPHITTRGSVPTHYHARLLPHTLPQEAPSPHIITRGSVPTHYHTRLCPHTLPHEAPSPHITTRGSIPTHYHMRL